VKADVFQHLSFFEALADAAHAGRDAGTLFAIRSPGDMQRATVLSQFHFSYHTSWASYSSQSRARNSTLKITKESSASTIAIAFAASICPSLNFAKMCTGAVWVRPARLPETRIVEPNSPTARAKVSKAPVTIAPRRLGSVTCQKVCQREAPMVAEAS